MLEVNSHMSQTDLIAAAHNATAMPALIIFAVYVFLLFLLIGLAVVGTKSPKYWQIYISTAVLSIAFLLILIFIPDVTQWFVKLFS